MGKKTLEPGSPRSPPVSGQHGYSLVDLVKAYRDAASAVALAGNVLMVGGAVWFFAFSSWGQYARRKKVMSNPDQHIDGFFPILLVATGVFASGAGSWWQNKTIKVTQGNLAGLLTSVAAVRVCSAILTCCFALASIFFVAVWLSRHGITFLNNKGCAIGVVTTGCVTLQLGQALVSLPFTHSVNLEGLKVLTSEEVNTRPLWIARASILAGSAVLGFATFVRGSYVTLSCGAFPESSNARTVCIGTAGLSDFGLAAFSALLFVSATCGLRTQQCQRGQADVRLLTSGMTGIGAGCILAVAREAVMDEPAHLWIQVGVALCVANLALFILPIFGDANVFLGVVKKGILSFKKDILTLPGGFGDDD